MYETRIIYNVYRCTKKTVMVDGCRNISLFVVLLVCDAQPASIPVSARENGAKISIEGTIDNIGDVAQDLEAHRQVGPLRMRCTLRFQDGLDR